MTRYISNPDNLKLMMNMLKEKSRNIQFEAFHVFKVCVCVCVYIYIYSSIQIFNSQFTLRFYIFEFLNIYYITI